MANIWGAICISRKVCQGNFEEVPHGEKKTHGDSSCKKLEEGGCYFRQSSGCYYLQPNICYVVNKLNQAMVKLTKLFWKAGKHVLRYLMGTTKYGLWYRWIEGVKLQGFTDVYWVGNPPNTKSTSGGIFSIGSTVVSWYSRKQRSVALSLAKAEYMAASQAACKAIWMRKILVGFFGHQMDPTVTQCANQSCIKLSLNLLFHNRSKHIDKCYHHIRDFV